MDFYDVVSKRRSIRGYKDEAISDEALDRICEAVRQAPSACNLQPWSFRIVFDLETREKIHGVYDRDWLLQAPAVVVALGNKDEAWKRLDGHSIVDMDMGIAMEHFVLAATAEGLGTCWVCAYDVNAMNQALGILPPWSVLAISPLGAPAETPRELNRKPVDEIVKIIR